MSERKLFIGCAGWTIPASERSKFPQEGSQLERYSAVFSAVEINSSFYRPHRGTTYSRWADSVPDDFRFSVKVPKAITHDARLTLVNSELGKFVADCSHLGTKLGCLLVQLPPSLGYDIDLALTFFRSAREATDVDICCEPRHASWVSDEANALFADYRIDRVTADPSPFPAKAFPAATGRLLYYRMHGSPKMYFSSYAPEYLELLALKLQNGLRANCTCWCIFDNTAIGAASQNAFQLLSQMPPHVGRF